MMNVGFIGTNAALFQREFSEGQWMLILWETGEVFQVLDMKCVMSVYLCTVRA